MVTGDNDSPSFVPEIHTAQFPSQTALSQPARDHNELLETTLAATEQTPPVAMNKPLQNKPLLDDQDAAGNV